PAFQHLHIERQHLDERWPEYGGVAATSQAHLGHEDGGQRGNGRGERGQDRPDRGGLEQIGNVRCEDGLRNTTKSGQRGHPGSEAVRGGGQSRGEVREHGIAADCGRGKIGVVMEKRGRATQLHRQRRDLVVRRWPQRWTGFTELWPTIVQEIDVPYLRCWRVIRGRWRRRRWRMDGAERECSRQGGAILQQLDLQRNSCSWNRDGPTPTKHLPEGPDALPERCLWHRSSLCQSA